jgi:hypothetical protein
LLESSKMSCHCLPASSLRSFGVLETKFSINLEFSGPKTSQFPMELLHLPYAHVHSSPSVLLACIISTFPAAANDGCVGTAAPQSVHAVTSWGLTVD